MKRGQNSSLFSVRSAWSRIVSCFKAVLQWQNAWCSVFNTQTNRISFCSFRFFCFSFSQYSIPIIKSVMISRDSCCNEMACIMEFYSSPSCLHRRVKWLKYCSQHETFPVGLLKQTSFNSSPFYKQRTGTCLFDKGVFMKKKKLRGTLIVVWGMNNNLKIETCLVSELWALGSVISFSISFDLSKKCQKQKSIVISCCWWK